uniref:Uncharacterized protein n=1 Tax=Caenorhabditis tropicalis TaxID=1561998 RepID=A0A1I7T5F8_9PELO
MKHEEKIGFHHSGAWIKELWSRALCEPDTKPCMFEDFLKRLPDGNSEKYDQKSQCDGRKRIINKMESLCSMKQTSTTAPLWFI